MPGAPSLTATGLYKSILLEWTAPSDNGGAAISSYRIERQNDQGIWVIRTASLPGSSTSRTDTGLGDNIQYTYRIFALNAAGESDWDSTSAVTLANLPEVPTAPLLVTTAEGSAVAGPASVTLSWVVPAFSGGSPITKYQYRYKESGESFGGYKDVDKAKTEVEVTGLTPGTVYNFEVRAVNSVGAGSALELTQTPDPSGPTGKVTSLGADASNTDGDDPEEVTLTWTILDAADTDINGGSVITGYEIESKTSEEDDDDWAAFDGTQSISGSTRTLVHDSLLPGTIYQYRIRAYNNSLDDGDDAGNIRDSERGPWSNTVSETTAALVPRVMVAPSLSADVTSITVSWVAPVADTNVPLIPGDGGADITSYEIYASDDEASGLNADGIAALKPTRTNLPSARAAYDTLVSGPKRRTSSASARKTALALASGRPRPRYRPVRHLRVPP